jgi:hypothetical protein
MSSSVFSLSIFPHFSSPLCCAAGYMSLIRTH